MTTETHTHELCFETHIGRGSAVATHRWMDPHCVECGEIIEPTAEDLANAAIPGFTFDPETSVYSPETTDLGFLVSIPEVSTVEALSVEITIRAILAETVARIERETSIVAQVSRA